MKALIVLIFCFYILNAFSQNTYYMTIHDTYGGQLLLVKKTPDGNLLMAGSNFVSSQELFSKVDSIGNLSFSKALSMTSNFSLLNMMPTPTGYLLLFNGGGVKMFLVATDFNGSFQSIIGYNSSDNFGGRDFYRNLDASLIIAGNSGSTNSNGAFIMKVDSNGSVLWNKKFTYSIYFRQLDRVIDDGINGFYIFGSVSDSSFFNNKAFVAKFDTAGNVLWSKLYGIDVRNILSVDRTPDTGFILASNFEQGLQRKTTLLKIDSVGNLEWNKIYSDPFGDNVEGIDVKAVFNQGFILTGNYGPNFPAQRAFLVRTDLLGNILWSVKYEGVTSEYISNVCVMNDSGFAFSGTANGFGVPTLTTGYLGKTDSLGMVGCFEQSISIDTSSQSVSIASFSFTETSLSIYNQSVNYPTSLIDNGHYVCSTLSLLESTNKNFIGLTPIPTDSKLLLNLNITTGDDYELIIFDLFGKVVNIRKIKMEETEVDVSKISNGVYFYTLNNHLKTFKGRIVINH